MSVEFDRGSPRKFDSRTLNREALNRWTGRINIYRSLIILDIIDILNCPLIIIKDHDY